MGTRRKAKSDLKIEQGKRRDAYFAHLRRDAQPKASLKAGKTPEPTKA
jgi:hypothetical protein